MSIFDGIVNTELENGNLTISGAVNPSLSASGSTSLIGSTIIEGTSDTIRDNRIAADTGKLVHNWWISYMKSLKKFFNDTFDDSIVNYEFNYAAKSMLLKRLYSRIQQENPSCIINLDSFSTDNNLDPQRRNSGLYNLLQTTPLCKNYSKTQEILIDFKFVNISQTIILNFNDSSDVMNYYDRLTTVYPLNINFISYDYRTLINVHAETMGWELTDNIEGIIVDAAELGSDNYAGKNQWAEFIAPQRWAEYTSCPTFMINSINQLVDKQNEKYQLQLNLTTVLRVPQTLIFKAMDSIKIRAIQIVMDVAETLVTEIDENGREIIKTYGDASFKPICIDIDRQVYASNKIDNVVVLDPLINIIRKKTLIPATKETEIDFYLNEGFMIIPAHLEGLIENRGAALFIIQDSTVNKPKMNWAELGILHKEGFIFKGEPDLNHPYRLYHKEVWNQENINENYKNVEEQYRPKLPTGQDYMEIIRVNIPSFGEWSEAFDEIGPWFNIRLLTFHVLEQSKF